MKLQPTISFEPFPREGKIPVLDADWLKRYLTNLRRLYEQLVKAISTVGYDITVFWPTKPGAGQLMFHEKVARQITFEGNFLGSTGYAAIASTGTATFNVRRNGVIVGHIVYSAGQLTPAFDTVGGAPMFFDINSVLSIDAPAGQDATLSGTSWVFTASKDF